MDEFSGTRGPLDRNGDNQLVSGALYLHGRHILNAVLRDLVDKFAIEKAATVVLIGSGKLFHFSKISEDLNFRSNWFFIIRKWSSRCGQKL